LSFYFSAAEKMLLFDSTGIDFFILLQVQTNWLVINAILISLMQFPDFLQTYILPDLDKPEPNRF